MAKATKKKTASSNGKSTGKNRIAAEPPTKTIEIAKLNVGVVELNVKGISPLVCNRFSEDAEDEMLAKQTTRAKKAKELRSPETEFLDSLYWIDGDQPQPDSYDDEERPVYDEKKLLQTLSKSRFGIPIEGFGQAIVATGRNVEGVAMTQLRQQVFVKGVEDPNFAVIRSPKPPIIDRRVAWINKVPIVRFRPMFEQWSTTVRIEYDANCLSAKACANLLSIAGFYVGVLEGRPEKTSRLGWGRFEVR